MQKAIASSPFSLYTSSYLSFGPKSPLNYLISILFLVGLLLIPILAGSSDTLGEFENHSEKARPANLANNLNQSSFPPQFSNNREESNFALSGATALPPGLAISFSSATIKVNGTTALAFSITNPNSGTALTNVSFVDNLPSQLMVATSPGISNSCGNGTVTATAGSTTINISGVIVGAALGCTISINVTSTTAGSWNNSISQISSTESGPATINASATLTVSTSATPVIIGHIPGAGYPYALGVNPVTKRLYSVSEPGATVFISDITTYSPLGYLGVGQSPQFVAVNSTTNRMYVPNNQSNTVSVIDGTTNAVSTINVGNHPAGIALNPNNNRIYVANQFSNTVSVIDGTTNIVMASIPVGGNPYGVDINLTTNRLYVANSGDATVTVIDLNANSVITTIGPYIPSWVIAVNPVTNRIYVGSDPMTVIDGATNTVITTIPLGIRPPKIALNPDTNRIYAPLNNNLAIIDGTSNTIIANVQVSPTSELISVAVDPTTKLVYVGDRNPEDIVVIAEGVATLNLAFNPTTINAGATSTLTFTLNNPNGSTLNNVSFMDTLPTQLKLASNPNATNSCGNGTVTANTGSNTISVSGIKLTANQTCTIGVNVTSLTAGNWTTAVNSISSSEGGTAPINSGATLSVLPVTGPTLGLSFSPNTIVSNGTSTLNFTLTNSSGSVSLNNISFSNTLPAQIIVGPTPGVINNCGNGTVTANPGGSTITITGVTLLPNQSCSIGVNVTSSTIGSWANTVTSISSNESGSTTISSSASLIVTTNNPLPNLVSFFPASAVAGNSAFLLTVNGTNFVNGATVQWNGNNRSTNFVSEHELVATITANDIATPGMATITVLNPSPGGGISVAQTFQITTGGNPVPTLTSLSPGSIRTGGPAFSLTISGTNFVNGAIVQWNGHNRPTTFVNSSKLTANIAALDITNPGIGIITVLNPAPGGGYSNLQVVNITPASYPVPTLTKLAPTSVMAGGPSFSLAINGTNFSGNSIVRWNGSDRVTTYISSTQLLADISASDIAVTDTAQLTVFNPAPGGGLSNSKSLSIISSCIPDVVNNTGDSPSCGTFRAAAQWGGLNPNNPISFALLRSDTITLNSPLIIPDGVTISGACTPGGPAIIVNGSAVSGDGLLVGRGVSLQGLKIAGFGGRQLVSASGTAKLKCVVVQKGR